MFIKVFIILFLIQTKTIYAADHINTKHLKHQIIEHIQKTEKRKLYRPEIFKFEQENIKPYFWNRTEKYNIANFHKGVSSQLHYQLNPSFSMYIEAKVPNSHMEDEISGTFGVVIYFDELFGD